MARRLRLLAFVMMLTLVVTMLLEFYVSKNSLIATFIISNRSLLTNIEEKTHLPTYSEMKLNSNGTFVLTEKTFNMNNRPQLNQDANTVAIGGALKMTPCLHGKEKVLLRQSLFRELLPSFCLTVSLDFFYDFIFVYDADDICLSNTEMRNKVQELFIDKIAVLCPRNIVRGLHLIPCKYHGKPAYAQNDAMMAAYWMNISYFYRYVSENTNHYFGMPNLP